MLNNASPLSSSNGLVPYKYNVLDYISSTTLPDNSIRYTVPYKTSGSLPKLNAVILDPFHKWNGHPKISLEFKKQAAQEGNLNIIYSSLKSLNANYEYREVSFEQGFSIEIIRITSNSIAAIAYLANLYAQDSPDTANLLIKSLYPAMRWVIDKEKPTLEQDFGIWMEHWADPDDEKTLAISAPVSTCLANQEFAYTNISLYDKEQKRIKKEQEYKARYKSMSSEEKLELFSQLINMVVTQKLDELTKAMSIENVNQMLEQITYESAQNISTSAEQCSEYLDRKYPELKQTTEAFATNLKNKIIKLEAPFLDLEKFSKNTKDTSSITGTLVFDFFAKYAENFNIDLKEAGLLSSSLPIIGNIISVAKLAACVISITTRNFGGKENIAKIDREVLAKEFTYKTTICTVSKFRNLTENGQETLADFFSQYVYKALKTDNHKYENQTSFINSLISRVHNITYVTELKLNKFLSTGLLQKDGNNTLLVDYLNDYNQTECYNEIQSSLIGEIALNSTIINEGV